MKRKKRSKEKTGERKNTHRDEQSDRNIRIRYSVVRTASSSAVCAHSHSPKPLQMVAEKAFSCAKSFNCKTLIKIHIIFRLALATAKPTQVSFILFLSSGCLFYCIVCHFSQLLLLFVCCRLSFLCFVFFSTAPYSGRRRFAFFLLLFIK